MFAKDNYKEISEYMTKRLSCTEHPFLTPPCTPYTISPMASDNFFNLEFIIEVINFPILEARSKNRNT